MTKTGEQRILRWSAEFAVVFLGVYAAFLLDGCREDRRDRLRRHQILSTLERDYAEGAAAAAQALEWFNESLDAPVLQPLGRGQRPRLLPVPLMGGFDSNSWGGTLAAGGFEVLDVDLIREVERSLAAMERLSELAREYNDYVRTVLVPNLEAESEEFYSTDDSRLKPKYLWYYFSLRRYRETLSSQQEQFEKISRMIAERR